MENLPETLYDVVPTPGGSSSSSTATGSTESAAAERARLENCINMLHHPSHREEALALLNKERLTSQDMALLLWKTKNIAFILLQEICMGYKSLSPPTMTMKEATRVCNAIALLQSLASNPNTKMGMVKALMPVYIYPFMSTTENRMKHFDYLRLTSLGVIGALVKVEDNHTPEIIHFLLDTEMFPLCLRCLEVGSQLAKAVAAFILSKILLYEEGQRYCGTFPERFYAVSQVLANTIEQFPGKPPSQLLKHILTCFMRLTEVSRLVGAGDVLTKCYPAKLRDPAYLNFACEDMGVRRLADQVLHNVIVQRKFG